MIKILLIDDEEMFLENVSIVLENKGYHVVTAGNGEEGIKKFDELSFDIVITDLAMPKFTGDKVARHVRNSGRNIPVIGITGASFNFDLSCFDLVINKPFRFEEFLKGIKETLNQRRFPSL